MIGRHIEPHTRRAIRRSGRQFVRGGGEGIARRCGDLSSPESEQFVSDWTYYDRKVAEGMAHTSALRALKCRISDALYAQLIADQQPTTREADQDSGGQSGNDSASSAAGSHPEQPALRTSHSRAGTHSRISHRFTEPVLTRRPALLGADQAAGQPKRHFPAQEQATTASTPDTKVSICAGTYAAQPSRWIPMVALSLLALTLDGFLPVCTVTGRRVGADGSDVGYRDRLDPDRAAAVPAAPSAVRSTLKACRSRTSG
jgi:hypothetical protein